MNGFVSVFQVESRIEPTLMSQDKDRGQQMPMYYKRQNRNTVAFSDFLDGEMLLRETQQRATV